MLTLRLVHTSQESSQYFTKPMQVEVNDVISACRGGGISVRKCPSV